MTFMDDYLAGRTDGCDLRDHVQEWHLSQDPRQLHEYLGMTWDQFIDWFDARKLPERGAP